MEKKEKKVLALLKVMFGAFLFVALAIAINYLFGGKPTASAEIFAALSGVCVGWILKGVYQKDTSE